MTEVLRIARDSMIMGSYGDCRQDRDFRSPSNLVAASMSRNCPGHTYEGGHDGTGRVTQRGPGV